MPKLNAVITTRSPSRVETLHAGLDSYQRRIGLRIEQFEAELQRVSQNTFTRNSYPVKPGCYHVARVTTTRDGTPNGPHQGLKFFPDDEARQGFIKQRTRDFRKRHNL